MTSWLAGWLLLGCGPTDEELAALDGEAMARARLLAEELQADARTRDQHLYDVARAVSSELSLGEARCPVGRDEVLGDASLGVGISLVVSRYGSQPFTGDGMFSDQLRGIRGALRNDRTHDRTQGASRLEMVQGFEFEVPAHRLLWMTEERVAPHLLEDGSFVPGRLTGTLWVYEFASDSVICGASVHVTNNASVATSDATAVPQEALDNARLVSNLSGNAVDQALDELVGVTNGL